MPTLTGPKVELGELSRLPAGPILVRLRRVLITTGIAAVVYSMLSTGSAGTCSGAGIVIALVSGAIALTWMMLFPIDTLADGGAIVFPFPFPFGSAELTVTHQP